MKINVELISDYKMLSNNILKNLKIHQTNARNFTVNKSKSLEKIVKILEQKRKKNDVIAIN